MSVLTPLLSAVGMCCQRRRCSRPARQACCTLLPAFPDLPEERSATIEANIVNQNFTFVARYMASQRFAGVRGRPPAAPAARHGTYAGHNKCMRYSVCHSCWRARSRAGSCYTNCVAKESLHRVARKGRALSYRVGFARLQSELCRFLVTSVRRVRLIRAWACRSGTTCTATGAS